jgi:hypothetical protein
VSAHRALPVNPARAAGQGNLVVFEKARQAVVWKIQKTFAHRPKSKLVGWNPTPATGLS